MLELYGKQFTSRMLLGTAGYASPDVLRQAVEASGAEIVTVSLRRESARARTGQGFWELIEKLGRLVLPNTAGCRTAKEAVATAQMARELFGTNWIKLEVIANDDTLQPELFGLVDTTRRGLAGHSFGGSLGLFLNANSCSPLFCDGSFNFPGELHAEAFNGTNSRNPFTGVLHNPDTSNFPEVLVQGPLDGITTLNEGLATFDSLDECGDLRG